MISELYKWVENILTQFDKEIYGFSSESELSLKEGQVIAYENVLDKIDELLKEQNLTKSQEENNGN